MHTHRPDTASPRRLLFSLLFAGFGLAGVQFPLNAANCPVSTPAGTPPGVLTSQFDNARDGYNASESVLTSTALANGSVALCQPTWSPLAIDAGPGGQTNGIWAQPLYVPKISVASPAHTAHCNDFGSKMCNMLVSVTLNGSVFAWNADTGATLWSDCQGAGCTNNAPWVNDCGATGSVSTTWGLGGLPFAGIISTPVIDRSSSPPVMYTTSLCQTSAGGSLGTQWWIHEIDLTTGLDVCAGGTWDDGVCSGTDLHTQFLYAPSGQFPFMAWQQVQRSSLLEVRNPGTGGLSNLIYVPFASGEGETNSPYHGWVFGFNGTPTALTQKFAFNTSSSRSNTQQPACSLDCYLCNAYDPNDPGSCNASPTCTPGSNPPCCCSRSCVPKGYRAPPNWCGQGAGSWMAGEGPAANTLNGVSHAYLGTGNGPFQQFQSDGVTLANQIFNWGQSILDFTFSGSSFSSSPSEYFTPYGGLPVQEPAVGAPLTFESMNLNDFDMAVCGILLFNDTNTNPATPRALTCDKAGYGYLLTQGNLCGSPTSECYPGYSAANGGQPGGALGDPGNTFPFGASYNLCTDKKDPDTCDRITSLAFYPDGSPQRLYFWPYQELMTSFQLSNNSPQNGSGTLSTGTSLTSVTLSVENQVLVGDQITNIPGQPTQTVTAINYGSTQITVSPGFNSAQSGVTGWQYNGYFINPVQAQYPGSGAAVQYPGGAVEVTSNKGSNPVVWAVANIQVGNPCPPNCAGTIFAYDATSLNLLWCTNSLTYSSTNCDNSTSFVTATFARPTVVNGNVYVPTYGGITKAGNPNCTSAEPCSGIIVYVHNP
jgi:hypothetical protein